MLYDDDLASMRADAAELRPASCVIETRSVVSDGAGGQRETFTPGAAMECRLAPVGGGEKGATGDRIDDRTTHVLTLLYETTIASKDRVVVAGTTYEVTAVRTRPEWEVARRVELMEAP